VNDCLLLLQFITFHCTADGSQSVIITVWNFGGFYLQTQDVVFYLLLQQPHVLTEHNVACFDRLIDCGTD